MEIKSERNYIGGINRIVISNTICIIDNLENNLQSKHKYTFKAIKLLKTILQHEELLRF